MRRRSEALTKPQGLALHISMERYVKPYTLWVLCMDDEVHNVLSNLNLPNLRLLLLSELETPELLSVKPGRSIDEYCWTLTPFAPRFVFEADSTVPRVTYLDADLWFRKNPVAIFHEFESSGKPVLITDHSYAPEYDQSAIAGQYCVQFMTFVRERGEIVRKWWEESCIEWCFARYEDGKFGDQKYLDDWPVRYADLVHVLTDKELMLAPWNATRFPYSNSVAWHFHALRIVSNIGEEFTAVFGDYHLPQCTQDNVYRPYLDELSDAVLKLNLIGVALVPQIILQTLPLLVRIKRRLKRCLS